MKRIFCTFLSWTLILYACSTEISSPASAPPVATANPSTAQDCGYQWANKDLPELTTSFQQSIQELQAEAQASAYAFGENCLRSDGSVAGFSAMETDFNISLQVRDLTNESDLGEWIVKVMRVIEKLPKEQIQGPRPGLVSITFQSTSTQKMINFYTNKYQALEPGLSNPEVYQRLQVPQ